MTRRSHLAVASLIGVAVALVGSACASGGTAAAAGGSASTSSNLSYGYMIVGSQVATAFGIRATDTLPELNNLSNLPATVRNAFSQEVASGNWANACTRRFGGPTVYAAIFHRTCDASRGPEADPVVIVGFAANGRVIGRVPWTGKNTVTLLVPDRRF